MCGRMAACLAVVVCVLLRAAVCAADAKRIVFDTDMYTDYDDVGALALLHTLADAGECEILGTVVSTRGAPGVGMVETINAFYGRADLPVGEPHGLGIGPATDPGALKNRSYRIYADMVAKSPAARHRPGDAVPDANGVYRRLLAAAPDGGVTICSVGFTTNLRRLLETGPDELSPLNGRELVAKKVKAWYAMACRHPRGREYNSCTDGESSRIAFSQWPTPVYFLDFHYGRNVRCGIPVSQVADPVNPVRDVFKRALADYGETERGHSAWDEITVLAAVRGWERYFDVERGRFDIVDGRGTNAWTPDPGGNHFVLKEKTPKAEVGRIVDELMARGRRGAEAACEWISVKDAPVAGEAERRRHRAADGTSVFWRRAVNAKRVRRIRWETSALGVYELYLNGRRVGGDFLKPGYTANGRTKYAFSYDVTDLARLGEGEANDFGAEVSAGWWRDAIVGHFGAKSAFRGIVEYTYEDGTTERRGTRAEEWSGAVAGPVTHAGIFDGEEFDARETNGARRPGERFVPGGCERNDEFAGEVVPTAGAEVTLREDLAMRRGPFAVRPGAPLVVDFGQNCAAVPRFRFKAARGTVLTVLPGEMLNDAEKGERGSDGPKGSVYRANLRTPDDGMRLVYTFAGEGVETYLPRFTFFGYRYLSIAATGDVEIESVESVPVTSVTREMETGRVETGDASVNRLIANARWGQLSNYLSVPTDCPQRNERCGWTADTQVFAETGAFFADTSAFMRKWMRDMRDSVSATGAFASAAPAGCYGGSYMRLGWGDAGVIVPYLMWRQFGDRRIVDENFAAMARYVAHVAETKFETAAIRPEMGKRQYADWLSVEKFTGPKETYWDYLGACHWLWDARLMEEMARATGRDGGDYAAMAEKAKAHLRARFVDPADGLLLPPLRALQTANLFALKLGLVEGTAKAGTAEELRRNFAAHDGCLQTGFLGTSILMDTLTENGMSDLAYDILLSHRCPGWLYSVDQGATTIWERWNSYTKADGFGPAGMNSFNHYAYGAVVAWIFRTVAGIAADPAAPGFRNVVMAPRPDRRLGFAKAEYRSAAGLVRSEWRYEGTTWTWDFEIPEGATATVTLPGETVGKSYAAGSHRVTRDGTSGKAVVVPNLKQP